MSMYSSYTDLDNVIKENVVVGHKPDDRVTNQKVRFFNRQNEYWGTFEGVVNSKNAQIEGGVIKDVRLEGCQIYNPETQTKVDLSYIDDDLAGIYEDIDGIQKQLSAVSVKSDMSMKFCGVIPVSSYIETFSELFSVANDQLGLDDELIPNQLFRLNLDALTADKQLSVEGITLKASDFIFLKTGKLAKDINKDDISILRQIDAEDINELDRKIDHVAETVKSVDEKTVVMSMSEYAAISVDTLQDGKFYFIYEDPIIIPEEDDRPECDDCDCEDCENRDECIYNESSCSNQSDLDELTDCCN